MHLRCPGLLKIIYHPNCSALRALAILQNIRNSQDPCPASSSYFGGSQDRIFTFVQAQVNIRSFDPGINKSPRPVKGRRLYIHSHHLLHCTGIIRRYMSPLTAGEPSSPNSYGSGKRLRSDLLPGLLAPGFHHSPAL